MPWEGITYVPDNSVSSQRGVLFHRCSRYVYILVNSQNKLQPYCKIWMPLQEMALIGNAINVTIFRNYCTLLCSRKFEKKNPKASKIAYT